MQVDSLTNRDRTFKTETELCAAFIPWAAQQGWTAYAETAGWDILLVDASGRQLGIQAKLRFNATLLRQVLPEQYQCEVGPDFRAILLPARVDLRGVLQICGVEVFTPSYFGCGAFEPNICDDRLLDWNPAKRCELPAYVPDVAAGASSPIVLTDWKVRALRACALLEVNGYITAKQIRELGMDPRRWIHPGGGWLKPKHGTRGVYVRGDRLCFDRQHPDVYSQIKSETTAGLQRQCRSNRQVLRREGKL